MCAYWKKHKESLNSKQLEKLSKLADRHGQTVDELIKWLAEN